MSRRPFSRYVAGLFAIAFVALLQRAGRRPGHVGLMTTAAFALIASTMFVPSTGSATGLLTEGTSVRAEFAQVEAGSHEGTLRRAQGQCWMIFLSKPTRDSYTLIALTTAKRVQVLHDGQWTDAAFADNLQAQPASCREEGSD